MAGSGTSFQAGGPPEGEAVLHFTPAEWCKLLEDAGFLDEPDNDYSTPRRLMGVPVEIVPDHHFG